MDKVFLDVGANTGQTFTDFLSTTNEYDGWTVICLEPSPRHLSGLMATASKFQERYKIIICPFGLGGDTGVEELYQKDDPRGDSFEAELHSDHEVKNDYTLPVVFSAKISLRDLVDSLWLSYSEIVLKLDCEGSEYDILESFISRPLSQVKEIRVEWHQTGSIHISREEIEQKCPVPLIPWTL